ncbi:hypothetical protein PENTCL1PPCAC_12955, partial [Pristionchus entomophagus]
RVNKDGEVEEEEEGEEEVLELAWISRENDLICLLDNEQFHRENDLYEFVERMGEIDRPKGQLPLLLNWALNHRSAMGFTLAARIIKIWSLPSTRSSLLIFIVSAHSPPSIKNKVRRSSGGTRGKTKDGRWGRTRTRFLLLLARLFLALSYEGLVTYNDLNDVYMRDKEYYDGRSEG